MMERTELSRWLVAVVALALGLLTTVLGDSPAAAVPMAPATTGYTGAAYVYGACAQLSSSDTVLAGPRGSPERPGAASGVSPASVQDCGVAANTGPVLGPARNTDLVLDSFRGLGAGRNAHVRTVGSVEELQGTFNSWTVGAERLAPRGPNVPDVYRLPDGGVVQWRTTSRTGGPSIDIITPSGRPRTVHLAGGATW